MYSFKSALHAEVLPTFKGLNNQQKSMKSKAKQPTRWKRGKGDQKVTSTKAKVKAASAFQIFSFKSNEHKFQNTCPNGVIQHLK